MIDEPCSECVKGYDEITGDRCWRCDGTGWIYEDYDDLWDEEYEDDPWDDDEDEAPDSSAPKQPAITIACPVHGTQPVVMRDGPPQYVLCELCAQHRCPVCGRVCDCEPAESVLPSQEVWGCTHCRRDAGR